MRFAIVFLLLLTTGGVSLGDSGYTYSAPYYWKAGVAYTDHGYYYPEYYTAYTYSRCGCYKYPYQTYRWVWYADYRAVKIDPAADDIETKILALAASRDKAVLAIAAREQKSTAALALVDKLGLNYNVPLYGAGIFPVRNYGYQQAAYGQPVAYQVSQYAQRVDTYGADPNYDIVNQAIARNTERSMDLTAQIAGPLAEWRGTYERVAIARANGQTAIGVAQALAPKSTHIETRSTTVGPARLQLQEPVRAAVRVSAAASCVECHAGAGKNVKAFDVTQYDPATADAEMIERVFKYVRPGGKPHCPPGQQLPADKINELTIAPAPMPQANP